MSLHCAGLQVNLTLVDESEMERMSVGAEVAAEEGEKEKKKRDKIKN